MLIRKQRFDAAVYNDRDGNAARAHLFKIVAVFYSNCDTDVASADLDGLGSLVPELALVTEWALAAVLAGALPRWGHELAQRATVFVHGRLHGSWAAQDVPVGDHPIGLVRHVRRRLARVRALALAVGLGGISPCFFAL